MTAAALTRAALLDEVEQHVTRCDEDDTYCALVHLVRHLQSGLSVRTGRRMLVEILGEAALNERVRYLPIPVEVRP